MTLEGCGRRLSANEVKSDIACKQLLCVAQAVIARLETTLARTGPGKQIRNTGDGLNMAEYG